MVMVWSSVVLLLMAEVNNWSESVELAALTAPTRGFAVAFSTFLAVFGSFGC